MAKDLEEKLDELKLEGEVLTQETENARLRNLKKEMREQYGPKWKQIIGWRKRDGTAMLESLSQARFTIR